MNLSQDCFIIDNLNEFIELRLMDCTDECAAMHIRNALRDIAGQMNEFPDDEWHGITLTDGTKLDVNLYMHDDDGDGVEDLECISVYTVIEGQTDIDSGTDIYRSKLNIVKPVDGMQSRKTFKVKVWTKKSIEVDIEAETPEEAEENAKVASALGEFENEDFEDDDFGVECLGEVKDYEIEVMVPVKARFNQKACNAEDAITTVKAEIATGSFDLALLTDYDTKNAQVVYIGNPNEDNNKEP